MLRHRSISHLVVDLNVLKRGIYAAAQELNAHFGEMSRNLERYFPSEAIDSWLKNTKLKSGKSTKWYKVADLKRLARQSDTSSHISLETVPAFVFKENQNKERLVGLTPLFACWSKSKISSFSSVGTGGIK